MLFGYIQILEQQDHEPKQMYVWIWIACILNTMFLVELILYFWAFGFMWVVTRKKILYVEIVLSLIAIGAEIDFIFADSYEEIQNGIAVVCTVFLFRTFRLVILI